MSVLLLLSLYDQIVESVDPSLVAPPRTETSQTYISNGRSLTVTAYDAVGVDDVMENMLEGTLHQKLTGEQLVDPVPREIKDWQIRTNLNI